MDKQMIIPPVGTTYNGDFEISKEKVFDFARFSGDNNPLHVLPQAAKDWGFKAPVCHGAILVAELSRIIGTELPGEGAFWNDSQFDFSAPVYWGETVHILVEVIQSSEAVNMIKLKIGITRGNTAILSGTCRVLCLKKLTRRIIMPEKASRTVLITGGSRGLGLAIVKEFLNDGYGVITISRADTPELKQLRNEFQRLNSFYMDLNDCQSMEEQLKIFPGGEVNVLVHCAGPVPTREYMKKELFEDMQPFFNIYLKALIRLLDYCIPYMKKNQYGRIITIGTSYIIGRPPAHLYSYVTAKEALWGFTKSLAAEYGKFNITSNMVSPAMMNTDLTAKISNAVKYEEMKNNPMERMVELAEVAKTVLFLCGEGATFINGTNIPLTGG